MKAGTRKALTAALILFCAGMGLPFGLWMSNALSNPLTPPEVVQVPAPAPVEVARGGGDVSPNAPAPAANGGHRALLVGVTKYDHLPESKHLAGPANDVVMFRDVLVSRFGFRADDIVILSETAKRDSLRPTKANIEREFKALAEAAKEGDQVVVYLAGHGDKQPEANPPDPDFPEPDGLDEIFLPADVKQWANEKERAPQAITDNEIGAWLKAITDKKAYVWATFDCCHSGNITRGSEVPRELEPGFLVPAKQLEAAQKAAAARPAKPVPDSPAAGMRLDAANKHLVALFACRSTETTPELLSPTPRGLLTSTVCEVLTQATEALTYRELVQRVQVRYAKRRQGAPSPAVEGISQDREILGTKQWPSRSVVVLTRDGEQYKLNAGQLHGVTAGTILAASGPAGTADARKRLGFVKVTEVGMADSAVELCEFEKTPAPKSLPDLCPCEPVFVDYGARRFKIGVDLAPGAARNRALAVLKDMADPTTGSVEVADKLSAAEWVIFHDPKGYVLSDASRARFRFALADPTDRDFREKLNDLLERVYRARNLLAVASLSNAEIERGGSAVRVEVQLLRHATKGAPGVPIDAKNGTLTLTAGEGVSYRVTNKSDFSVDVSLLIVGTDLAITPFFPRKSEAGKQTIAAGGTFNTSVGKVNPPFGPEQMVLIAVRTQKDAADFTVLAQEGLEQRRGGDRSAALKTPAGRLLEAALYRVNGTRGVGVDEATELGMRVIPWTTVSAKK